MRHDPTSIPPRRFVASLLIEWAAERVSSLPISGPILKRVFERTLRTPEDEQSMAAFAEMARALGDEGYFTERPWRTKREMKDFVRRVVTRLRS